MEGRGSGNQEENKHNRDEENKENPSAGKAGSTAKKSAKDKDGDSEMHDESFNSDTIKPNTKKPAETDPFA